MRRLLLLSVLFATGCPPDQDNLILDERFEDPVAFAQNWVVSGQVQLVTTYHPAEHALQPVGAATLTRAVYLAIYDPSGDGEWLEYSTPCSGEPELWNQQAADGSYQVFASIVAGAPTEWRRVHANLPQVPVDPYGSTATTISSLTLQLLDTSGQCPIDNLRLYQPGSYW